MNYFECCIPCVAPKRYPGCHGTCSEYKQARTKYDNDIAKVIEEKRVQSYSNMAICQNREAHVKHMKGNRRFARRDPF